MRNRTGDRALLSTIDGLRKAIGFKLQAARLGLAVGRLDEDEAALKRYAIEARSRGLVCGVRCSLPRPS